jgi:hypothetical protein
MGQRDGRRRGGVSVAAVVVLAGLTAARQAGAVANVWAPIGPPGGAITGLAFDSSGTNLAYATTAAGGFFRSPDGGVSWHAANAFLGDAHLQALVTFGSAVYVGGAGGVSRSTDRGRTFAPLPDAPTLITALAVGDGVRPPLFAAGIFAGAWRSDDGGDTWQEINEGLERDQTAPAAVIYALLVDPRRPKVVWAGSGNGVYRSLDSGAHWTRSSDGLSCLVTALALDSANTLYAGCYVDPAFTAPVPPALFVSTDLGATWHAAVRGLAARGVTALLAGSAGTVWVGTQNAGVFRTQDGGLRWSAAGTGTGGQVIGALAQAPRQPALLLAGSGLASDGVATADGPGIFRTTSAGGRWALTAAEPNATYIPALVSDARDGLQLTALDSTAGVFTTATAGGYWSPVDAGLPSPASIAELAGDTAVSGELYAAGTLNERLVLYRRGPGADTPWKPLAGVPAGCFGALTAGAGGQLFLGEFGPDGGGVCVSRDRGATWSIGDVGFLVPNSIAVAPADPNRVYASGYLVLFAPPGPTFFRSDDGGATWTGLGSLSSFGAHALAVDPSLPDLVYAATGVVQRSRDGGLTWTTVFPGVATAVWANPAHAGSLVAAISVAGSAASPNPELVVSDDGGDSWTPLTAGLPPNVAILDLAFAAGSPETIYAATAGGGVFTVRHPFD